MLGFLIGTACFIGLVKVLRGGYGYGHGAYGACGGYGSPRRHWGEGPCGGGYGGGRWASHGRFRGFRGHDEPWGGHRRQGFFLRALLEGLDTTPGQEKVIGAAYREIRDEAAKSKEELRATRADLAKAMRGANFDEVLFGELFARHDAVIERMRKAAMGAMGKVHEALDEQQRARLGDLIERGPSGFGYGV